MDGWMGTPVRIGYQLMRVSSLDSEGIGELSLELQESVFLYGGIGGE